MIIGLTGSIGCGKSTALNCFKQLDWRTIDADSICHQLYERKNQKLFDALRGRWRDREVFDAKGEVSRRKIADIVFNDDRELDWLDSIIHPLIACEADKMIKKFGEKDHCIIVDVPLLFESGWDEKFDAVVCVWTDRQTQLGRLKSRGWSEQEISKRLKRQFSADEKLERACFGLINNGSLATLEKQCNRLDRTIRTKLKR